jgi:chitin disaccharide deacetylase
MSEPAARVQASDRRDHRPAVERSIWLVADDYGISRAVNAAIRDLVARGSINATSVMVVASGFDDEEAAKLNALRGDAAIGLHLTLTAPFRPLSNGYGPTHGGVLLSLGETFLASMLRRLNAQAMTAEIRAQIARFTAAFGRPPDFIDGHQHVHLFPQIGTCVLSALREFVPGAWVRQCGRAAFSLTDRKAFVLDALSRRFRKRAQASGVRTNPAFAGTYDFRPSANFADLFATFLDDLPDGGVIMCHPGLVDAELARNDTLTNLREREYAFFKGEAFAELLTRRGYRLAGARAPSGLEHDPEKWPPVFGKDHAQTES